MLSFSGSLKVFVAVEPCDMRKGFNGLHAMASERLGEDPRQGALFVFTNRRHNRIKILYFDGTGLWVMTKRLEKGTFRFPTTNDPQARSIEISSQELSLVLWGIDPASVKRQSRYQLTG